MKTKRFSFFHILTTAWAVVLLAFAPLFAVAADYQRLPDTVAGQLGYNYMARITSADITNTVQWTQLKLWPRSGFAPAGSGVTRAGVFVEAPFMTSTLGTSNAVDLSIGWSGSTALTNIYVSNLGIGSNAAIAWQTNCIARCFEGATNAVYATIWFTNSAAPGVLTNGSVYIYLQISDLAKATNNI